MDIFIADITKLVGTDGQNKYKPGGNSSDNIWTVMGGEFAGTDSTMTVGDLFKMGLQPRPSIKSVDGLSAANGTIYLRYSAINWENVIHENIHQLGGFYADDKWVMMKLWTKYSDKINYDGPSQQISNLIKEKCK